MNKDRIAFLYNNLVVDILTEAVGDLHSALSFSRRDLNPYDCFICQEGQG